MPTRAGIDPDFDFGFDRDNDPTVRPPCVPVLVLVLAASSCTFLGRAFEGAFSDRLQLEVARKAHWGIAEGTAAPDGENSRRGAEAQRGNGRGGCSCIGAVICHCLGLLKRDIHKIPQKCCVESMEPTRLQWQVENATAPSAGGSSDPDGKAGAFSDGLQLVQSTHAIHTQWRRQ
ncbi:MAG: hypothetical protein ACOX52_19380 [Verrucomicrobiota bacterium]